MPPKHQRKIRKVLKKRLRVGFLRFSFFLLGFTFLFLLFFLSTKDKVLINTNFGKYNLGALNRDESHKIVDRSIKEFENSKITFLIDDRIIEAETGELGIRFDGERTIDKVYTLGSPGKLFSDIALSFVSLFKFNSINPAYSFDSSVFSTFVEERFASIEKSSQDAKIISVNKNFEIVPSVSGLVIDRGKLIASVLSSVETLSFAPIYIEMVEDQPSIKKDQLTEALLRYKSLTSEKIILSYALDSWRLEGDNLISLLEIHKKGYLGDYRMSAHLSEFPILIKSIDLDESIEAEVGVDEHALNLFIGKISNKIDRSTINATAVFENGDISEFIPAVDGQMLDQSKTKGLIKQRLSATDDSNDKQKSISLPVKVTTAKVANDKINSLGIKELIGKGVSYFAGSIVNRIYNIQLGANRISGTLIAPGEVFSFNDTVGEVSGLTGYKPAYIISSGKTVLDDGGGICQVSSTVFRAALNSGLPIISRTAHAYRVGYYEQRGSGVGFDATVFSPAVDFKFKNDTNNYILVQAIFDKVNSTLEVDIYGTRDGRKVEISKPTVGNRISAPADRFQDDPTLPRGTVKQVDYSAEGADAYFTRKVFKDDRLIIDDSFKSHYQPWQAVYLVGSGG